jgi:hypothetical protein
VNFLNEYNLYAAVKAICRNLRLSQNASTAGSLSFLSSDMPEKYEITVSM